MDFKRTAAALLSAFAMVACTKAPIATEQTQNSEITYEVLFHRHSCEIGRFSDSGNHVYVTICPRNDTAPPQAPHN